MSLDIIETVAGLPSLKGWDGLGMAVQAYGKRCRPTLAWADAIGAATGRRIAVRLVKGAYWDSEIKRTQEQGLADYPLFTRKAATDVSYLACAKDMLAAKNIYPAFATHNALTVATILEWAGESRDFEFQRLHGMGEGLYESAGPRAGLSDPHLRAGRRPSRPPRLSRPPPARERRQFELRPPARRREPERRRSASPIRSRRSPPSAAPAIRRSRCRRDLFAPERPNSEGLDLNDRAGAGAGGGGGGPGARLRAPMREPRTSETRW